MRVLQSIKVHPASLCVTSCCSARQPKLAGESASQAKPREEQEDAEAAGLSPEQLSQRLGNREACQSPRAKGCSRPRCDRPRPTGAPRLGSSSLPPQSRLPLARSFRQLLQSYTNMLSLRLLGRTRTPALRRAATTIRPFVAAAPSPFSTAATRQASQADLHKAPSPVDQFANGNNAYYAEEMLRCWKEASPPCFPRWPTTEYTLYTLYKSSEGSAGCCRILGAALQLPGVKWKSRVKAARVIDAAGRHAGGQYLVLQRVQQLHSNPVA